MDLKEFVSQTLTQIAEGIAEAQKGAAPSGAWISPVGSSLPDRPGATVVKSPNGDRYLDSVHFDVAVSASEDKAGKAGAQLRILTVGIGADANTSTHNASVSRVQFSVPVSWPVSADSSRDEAIKRDREEHDRKMHEPLPRDAKGQGWMS